MTSAGAIVGLLLMVMAVARLFDRNAVWQRTEAGNRAWGFTPERTPEWDAVTRACGVGCVVFGAVWIAQALVRLA